MGITKNRKVSTTSLQGKFTSSDNEKTYEIDNGIEKLSYDQVS